MSIINYLTKGLVQFEVNHSIIAQNSAADEGGAVYNFRGQARLNYNRIEANTTNLGDDVYNDGMAFRMDATHNWWGDPNGPSGVGLGSGDSISINIDYEPFFAAAECPQTGPCDCEIGTYECADGKNMINPISLYKGEKRLDVTDLTLNTPAGPLSFTRTYRQSKQAEWQCMGLGWTHNHAISLTPPTGSPGTIVVRMPHGGEAHFTEQSTNHYVGDVGATSVIDCDGETPSQYTLTTADQSTYVFDDGGKLLSRSWLAGETWAYSYSGSQLTQVTDAYGNKLVFRYYTSGDHSGQLYRVGDQTFDDSGPGDPVGRYVEFGYTRSKEVNSSGAIIAGSDYEDSLLVTVQDVRGETWTYTYYAETDKHADVRQLNFLIQRESPLVDIDGDQVVDRVLTLEAVSYTMQGTELAADGSMELNNNSWTGIVGALPDTNEQSTVYVDEGEGIYSRHVYGDTAGKGIEGNAWDLVDGLTYIVTARVYPVSGTVKMQVTGRTDFDRNTGGSTGAWQTLRVVYKAATGATDVKLQFVTSGGAAEFYVDAVSIIETDLSVAQITQDRGEAALVTDLTFPALLGTATTENVAGTAVTTTHYFFGGVHVGTADPLGNEQGRDLNTVFRPQAQRDANGHETQLTWSADGKQLGQVTDALAHETAFNYDNNDRLWASLDADQRQTAYVYDTDHRQPTLVLVGAEPLVVDINGNMELDSGWSGVGAPAVNEQSAGQVFSGSFSRHVEAGNGQGIESTEWALEAYRTYVITARVYLVADKAVKMQVSGLTGFDAVSSVQTNAWQTLRAVHTVASDEAGTQKTLQFMAQADEAQFYVDAVSVWIAPEIMINGGMEQDSGWTAVNGPLQKNDRASTQVDSGDYARHVAVDTIGKGIQSTSWNLVANQKYVVLARVYPVKGTVKMQVPDVAAFDQETQGTGAWETLIVEHRPAQSTLDRTLQFVASALDNGTAEFYVDSVSIVTSGEIDVNGGMEQDSGWSNVGTPTLNQRSSVQVDTGAYSRYVEADAGEGLQSILWSLVANQIYTLRARVWVVDGVGSDTVKLRLVDSLGQEIPDTSDLSQATDRWETLSCVYSPDSDQSDVRLQGVADGGAAHFYVDTVSIEVTRELPLKGDMETADPSSGWSGVNTPSINERSVRVDSGTYFRHVQANNGQGIQSAAFALEQDHAYLVMARLYLVTNTAVKMAVTGSTDFDAVSLTDAQYVGRWQTLRAIHTVEPNEAGGQNLQFLAQAASADFYVDTVHVIDLGQISTTHLQDQVRWQEFAYDTKGRTLAERVISPADAQVTQETIRSYYVSGPGSGLLKQVVQTDLDGTNDATITSFYDSAGRVVRTQRNTTFGSCTASYTVYDAIGNVLASICNYLPGTKAPPATAQEAAGLYTASAPDDNHVTAHRYDALGRRVETTVNAGSPFEQTTLTFYDALGRVWRTIARYQPQESSAPGDWVWNDAPDKKCWEDGAGNAISHGSDNTENIIADTRYNALGLVRLRQDPLGNVTLYGYDPAGRLVKTIQNAATPGHNNDFTGASPDPDLSAYSENTTSPDQDLITEQVYDAAGNLIKTVDLLGKVSFTIYDALNRPIRTVRNPHDPDYDFAGDLDLSDYTLSEAPDTDLIEETEYDNMGRVVQTRRLLDTRGGAPQWAVTRYVYDELDRQVRTIANYVEQGEDPSLWVWDDAVGQKRWEQSDGTPIDHGNNDQNLITETVYDEAGRVQETLDVNRTRTRSVYDGLGRQVKTIANCSYTSGSPAPEEAAYKGNLSDPSADIITETFYDADGRVQKTKRVLKVNQAGDDLEWLWTLYGYDTLGRQVKLVQNASNPTYDMVGDPDLSGYTPSGLSDEDIISETAYDGQGRVKKVIDSRGNVSFYGYDTAGRRIKTVQNASNTNYDVDADPDLSGYTPAGSPGNDQDRITTTTYDLVGRVDQAVDAAGVVTVYVYDALGRRVRTVTNYVEQGNPVVPPEQWVWSETNQRWEDGSDNTIEHNTAFDQNLIADTTYNKAGQIIATRDSRGTQTAFVYDGAARRQQVKSAAGSALETRSYTCYDKSGRVLRTIANWTGEGFPDGQESGTWTFAPGYNDGGYNDHNRIVAYTYDAVGRRVKVSDPVGNETTTAYLMDGQVDTVADPEDVVSLYRYDGLRRRILVVQSYDGTANPEDPTKWVWDANEPTPRWEESDGTVIVHGDNDRNIIVQVVYDKAGRMLEQREPNGSLTVYRYDKLGRRITQVTNYKPQGTSDPANWVWNDNATPPRWERSTTDTTAIEHGTLGDENAFITQTAYQNVQNGNGFTGETRVTVTKPDGTQTIRDADRLGRPTVVDYGDSADTHKVTFAYNTAGSRESMTENDGTVDKRITGYEYDQARRVKRAKFNADGIGGWDEEVAYEYDLGGQRTRLTLPGNLSVTYTYDLKGRLVSLTDWDGHQTRFAHDNANRLISAERASGLTSRYRYDAAGRLRQLRHTHGARTLAHFAYEVDQRGNRTQALEALAHNATTGKSYAYDDASIAYQGTWAPDAATYMRSERFSASLQLAFFGPRFELTVGTGINHSIFDVYLNGSLWQSFDGYAASSGERTISADLASDGPHILELRNRAEHSLAAQADASYDATKFVVRFKQLVVPDAAYDLRTLEYTYDALARLVETRYNPGIHVDAADGDLLMRYRYAYDLAGNRTQTIVHDGIAETTTSYSYNAVNQLTGDGTFTYEYDTNGNLHYKKQGQTTVDTYTWDRANRLTGMGGLTYGYDGAGNRISQNNGVDVTQYLLDLQPSLPLVSAQTTNGNTDRFVHLPGHGIFAQEDHTGVWQDVALDGLTSARLVVDDTAQVVSYQSYTPIGVPIEDGFGSPFTFTGELLDANALLYLRARYYSPALGVFTGLDPVEMNNRYQYVGGNVINAADPSGMIMERLGRWDRCARQDQEACVATVYVGCNLPNSLASGVPALPFPAFTYGPTTLEPIYHYPAGTQLCVREIRGQWLRVSEYLQYNGETHWVYSLDPKNFSQRVIFEETDPSRDKSCLVSTPIAPTPRPTATSTPIAIGTPTATETPVPLNQQDFGTVKCVLYHESANDQLQALDIAHVIRNRMRLTGSSLGPASAVQVVTAPRAFQAWEDICMKDLSVPNALSIISTYAQWLIMGGDPLPPPTDPKIYSALFTWGDFAGENSGGLTATQLDQFLAGVGLDAKGLVGEKCRLLSDDTYIMHSGTSRSGHFTTFFSSDPGCGSS